jgi:hypothetical protein
MLWWLGSHRSQYGSDLCGLHLGPHFFLLPYRTSGPDRRPNHDRRASIAAGLWCPTPVLGPGRPSSLPLALQFRFEGREAHNGGAAAAGDDGGAKAIAAEVWQQEAETRKAPARGRGFVGCPPRTFFWAGRRLVAPVGWGASLPSALCERRSHETWTAIGLPANLWRAEMQRREFIAGLGSAATWPLAARAQQDVRVRRIGVLIGGDENDPAWNSGLTPFTHALADLGWTDGRNVRMDLRWGSGDINQIRAFAQELVGLQPDIIVTNATPADHRHPAGDLDNPDRLSGRGRSRRQRDRRAARPPEWKRHRLRQLGSVVRRQVA